MLTCFDAKSEGKRPLGKPRRTWEDGISINIIEYIDQMQLAKDWDTWWALVNTVMNIRVE